MKGGGEAVGPKSEIQLLKKGSLPPGGILKLWSKVADEGAVCSRSLRHLTLHLRSSEEQEDRCCW